MEIQLSGKAAEVVKAQVESGSYTDPAAFISDIVLKYEVYYKKNLKRLIERLALAWNKRIEAKP